LDVVLGNQIYIPKQRLNPGLRNRLLRLAAFQNPEFYKGQAMRLSTSNKPRVVACAEDSLITSGCPVAAWMTFARHSPILAFAMAIGDERRDGSRLEVTFQGELRDEQKAAADAMLRHKNGVLAATTAFGKTVGRMPPSVGAQFRTGCTALQGPIRPWLVGHRRTQG
jgi:hypothetical protein